MIFWGVFPSEYVNYCPHAFHFVLSVVWCICIVILNKFENQLAAIPSSHIILDALMLIQPFCKYCDQ